jgi:hypothetical protein
VVNKSTGVFRKRILKRPLNIAQLHWGFPPIIGGVETHLRIILPEMARRGHNVSLLTGSVENVKARYQFEGVEIYRTPLMDLNWLYKRGFEGLEEEIKRALSEFIDQTKPHIIHAHNMHYFSKLHTRTLEAISQKKGIPLILTVHNSWDDILFLKLTKDVKWTHMIAVSHYIKKELIGIGCSDRKITVIHHGIDTRRYRPGINPRRILKKYPELKNRRVIFHPARMGLGKGCDVSIKALNLVVKKFPDIILVMAGTKNIIDWGHTQQKDIAYIISLVKAFKVQKNVFMDMFSLDEIVELYALAQVCMYPSSVGEPFGLTMLESLASARPIIVTNSGGMPEIIRDGINGFVIPIKDFEVLASRIIELLSDDVLRERLGYTGRQMVEAGYTKEIVAKGILDIYRKAL